MNPADTATRLRLRHDVLMFGLAYVDETGHRVDPTTVIVDGGKATTADGAPVQRWHPPTPPPYVVSDWDSHRACPTCGALVPVDDPPLTTEGQAMMDRARATEDRRIIEMTNAYTPAPWARPPRDILADIRMAMAQVEELPPAPRRIRMAPDLIDRMHEWARTQTGWRRDPERTHINAAWGVPIQPDDTLAPGTHVIDYD